MKHSIFDEINDLVKFNGPLLAGLDPDKDRILDLYEKSGEAQNDFSDCDGNYMVENIIYDYCIRYIDAIKDVCCAIKINSAFFECSRFEPLFRSVCTIASDEGLYVIADVKRADIGNTSNPMYEHDKKMMDNLGYVRFECKEMNNSDEIYINENNNFYDEN